MDESERAQIDKLLIDTSRSTGDIENGEDWILLFRHCYR